MYIRQIKMVRALGTREFQPAQAGFVPVAGPLVPTALPGNGFGPLGFGRSNEEKKDESSYNSADSMYKQFILGTGWALWL